MMTISVKGLTLSLAALSFSACIVPGYSVQHVKVPEIDPREPQPGLATICIVRPQTFGALAAFEIFDNGHLVAINRGAEVYGCHLAQPGWHRVTARSDNDAAVDTLLKAGDRVFLRLEVRLGPDHLTPMDDAEALALLPRLNYVKTIATRADAYLCREPVPARGAPAEKARCGDRHALQSDRPAPAS